MEWVDLAKVDHDTYAECRRRVLEIKRVETVKYGYLEVKIVDALVLDCDGEVLNKRIFIIHDHRRGVDAVF